MFNRSITSTIRRRPHYRIMYYGVIAYACHSVMTLNKFYANEQNIYRIISNVRFTVLFIYYFFFRIRLPLKRQCLVNQWRLTRTKYVGNSASTRRLTSLPKMTFAGDPRPVESAKTRRRRLWVFILHYEEPKQIYYIKLLKKKKNVGLWFVTIYEFILHNARQIIFFLTPNI